jgi:flagellar hook-length control protein FliK
MPGTAAAVPAGTPALASEPVQTPTDTSVAALPEVPLPLAVTPEAPAVAVKSPVDEPDVEEEPGAEQTATGEALLATLLPPAIPAPTQPSRPPSATKAAVSAPSDEDGDKASPLVPGLAPPPVLPFAAPPSKAFVAASDGASKAAPPSPGGMAPLVAPPVPEAEAATTAPLSDAPAPPKPAHADLHVAERPTLPPAAGPAQTSVPTLPPELAGLHAAPRAGIVEASAPPPPSPARQVSSVAVALAFAPGGSNGFSLSLEPAELGRVEIHVQREGDSHSVRVTAERPETLALLQRDRHELDRGLAEAGLRVDSAGIDFSLETPAGGGFGHEPGTGQRGDARGHAGGTARLQEREREASPPRVLRSLLDLNI